MGSALKARHKDICRSSEQQLKVARTARYCNYLMRTAAGVFQPLQHAGCLLVGANRFQQQGAASSARTSEVQSGTRHDMRACTRLYHFIHL